MDLSMHYSQAWKKKDTKRCTAHWHTILFQNQKFRLFQTGVVCRQPLQILRKPFQILWNSMTTISNSMKTPEFLLMGRKHCEKWRSCYYKPFLLFFMVFSKDLYCRQVKHQGLYSPIILKNFWGTFTRMNDRHIQLMMKILCKYGIDFWG